MDEKTEQPPITKLRAVGMTYNVYFGSAPSAATIIITKES